MTTRLRFEPVADASDLTVAAAGEEPAGGGTGARLRFAIPAEQRRIKLKAKDPKAWQKERAARKLRRRLMVWGAAVLAALGASVLAWLLLRALLG
ncbi:MAG TPA: hypothetical protein VD929_09780 [Caulobacteraceae bacterium]|nr:hypothetical protein [Caulobacteraceae bacterium]